MLLLFLADPKTVARWNGGDASFVAVAVEGREIRQTVTLDKGRTEIRWDGALHAPEGWRRVSSLDLEGVRSDDRVVLFHTEARMARSAISFDTGRSERRLRFLVCGLAPGMWEIWRDGWVVEIGVPVRPGEAVLAFEERSGSYFVRRLD